MSEKKVCPVNRGKLLIGLEVCRREAWQNCNGCQYGAEDPPSCFEHLAEDALAYIGWLEEQREKCMCSVVTSSGMQVYAGKWTDCYQYIMQALAKGSEPGFLRIIGKENEEER